MDIIIKRTLSQASDNFNNNFKSNYIRKKNKRYQILYSYISKLS